jgi:hypothetical protein
VLQVTFRVRAADGGGEVLQVRLHPFGLQGANLKPQVNFKEPIETPS